jgi:hypothetical protein
MTIEELREKQKVVEERFNNRVPSNLHRIKGVWVKTKVFKPWFCQKNGTLEENVQ